MPSPVGHVLAGAAIYLAATTRERRSRTLLAIALLGSIAPDLDFVPGILVGDMRLFHHGMSHSLVFAAAFGVLTYVVARLQAPAAALPVSVIAIAVYTAHVLLDFVNVNDGTRGVALLWPMSHEHLGSNLRLFGRFEYGDISEGIWSVVRSDNVRPLLYELAILGSLVMALRRKEQIRRILFALRTRIGGRLG